MSHYRPFIGDKQSSRDAYMLAAAKEAWRPVWQPAAQTLGAHLELSFVTEHSIGSNAIRWFTHSDFSHVDIITPDGYRIGARTDHPVSGMAGVQRRDLHYSGFATDCRLVVPCSATEADYAYGWLKDQLGKPYDRTGLFRSFLFDDYNWRHDDSWWCSELAAVFIEKAGFPRCRCPANRMAPNDTYIYAGAFAVP